MMSTDEFKACWDTTMRELMRRGLVGPQYNFKDIEGVPTEALLMVAVCGLTIRLQELEKEVRSWR